MQDVPTLSSSVGVALRSVSSFQLARLLGLGRYRRDVIDELNRKKELHRNTLNDDSKKVADTG